VWPTLQEGSISYIIPDFRRRNQNFIWLAEFSHEKIQAFTESAFSLSATIERKLNKRTTISYGTMYKLLRSERSDHNGTFDLIKVPLQLRWSNADSLLNPTKGFTLNLKAIPSFQFINPQFVYSINTFTATGYYSLTNNDRCVFASKLMLGSIIGANEYDIPPPERFYAGSENTLRGYKYLTVSPLGRDHKPLGGRSLMIYSMEMRFRIGENFGLAPFFEIGNVYSSPYPDFNCKQLRSVGVGFSYHTPVGPLRCDIAVPLDRRRHLDAPCQIYFNIGQSF
jgi:translocation and assembly module TamA